jgi:cysteine desulfurase
MIYLDNASTTKVLDCARKKAGEMLDVFGNPSSMHGLGMAAKREVEEARKIVAEGLRADRDEVFFTSGGTEANAIALTAGLVNGKRVLVSKIEHPSVLETLRNMDVEIQYIGVLTSGKIDLEHFEELLDEDIALVSCMQVNNETGAVQPIAEMRGMMRRTDGKALLHVDAVQGFGKLSEKIDADMITVSAHKLGGIKGAGALYIKKGTKVKPLIFGGGQEKGIRSGTENTLAIACFGEAVKARFNDIERNYGHVLCLNERAREMLKGYRLLSSQTSAPYILSVAIEGVMAETVLHSLEMRGVYIGVGAACSANKKSQMSEGLLAMGISNDLIKGSIRLSFAPENTLEEVEEACDIINEVVADLRRIRR